MSACCVHAVGGGGRVEDSLPSQHSAGIVMREPKESVIIGHLLSMYAPQTQVGSFTMDAR